MAKYAKDTKKNTDLRQQMPVQDLTHEVVRQDTQHYTLGWTKIINKRNANKDEKMEMDRIYV